MKILKEFISTASRDYYGGMTLRGGNIWQNYSKSLQLVERSPIDYVKISHLRLNSETRDMGLAWDEKNQYWYVGDPWVSGIVTYSKDGGDPIYAWIGQGNVTGLFCLDGLLYACSNYLRHIKVIDVNGPHPELVTQIEVGYIQGGCCVRYGKLWVSQLTKQAPGRINECDMSGKPTGRYITLPGKYQPWDLDVDAAGNIWCRTNWWNGYIMVLCFQVEEPITPEPEPEPEDKEDLFKTIWEFIGKILDGII